MLTNAIKTLNNFLMTTDFKQMKFKESDFKPVHNHKNYVIAEKYQWITYNGYTFRIFINCEIEENLDEIARIKFSSRDANDNNHMVIAEYLSMLIFKFSFFISYFLCKLLDINVLINYYEKAVSSSKEKSIKSNDEEPYGGGVIINMSPSEIPDLKYHLFLGVLVNKENEIMFIYVIDLYNDYYD